MEITELRRGEGAGGAISELKAIMRGHHIDCNPVSSQGISGNGAGRSAET